MVELAPHTTGLVLAGGRSRRMGRDKAALDWHGRPLLRHIVEVLAPRVSPLVVVARPGQELPELPKGVDIVYDPVTDQGPLVALRHAWPKSPQGHVFVTGCDYPYLTAEVVDFLTGLVGHHDAAVPRLAGQTHPLLGLYRTTVSYTLVGVTNQGDRSMTALLESLDVRWVEDDEWKLVDPAGRMTLNVNTQEDYQHALGLDHSNALMPGERREARTA